MAQTAYIAVHGGAGVHGMSNEKEIKRALRKCVPARLLQNEMPHRNALLRACAAALESSMDATKPPYSERSERESPGLDMVENAIRVLEDDEHLNAGYGSNLTIDGTVECDAALMAGRGQHFGSVGAVSGCKNPIQLARAILDHARVPDKLGRVPPMSVVHPETLISARAKGQWQQWKQRLDHDTVAVSPDHAMLQDLADIQDTVGAVAWHATDGVAAGRLPTTCGKGAVFGAGCWARQSPTKQDGMACSISGTGEHIIRADIARKLGEALCADNVDKDPHDILNHILIDEFWGPCRERGEVNPSVGVLLMTAEDCGGDEPTVRLWCAFTTASMAIAHASSKEPKPKAIILRHPDANALRDDNTPRIFITSLSL
ncbi:nucleophile aminohydrolase [Crassisporium funariophilum]|nr:nucleophile aminohydrolase [Crassisporium funariophilum]